MSNSVKYRIAEWASLIDAYVQRRPFAVIFPLAVLIFFHFYWNWASTLAYADLHSGAASWAQAIGTVGAICAAIMMPIWERQRRVHHDQTIAAMRVAAELRSWLRICASVVRDLQDFNSSDGHRGSRSTSIPAFGFNMEQVAAMSVKHARVIYSIIEQRERAEGSIDTASFLIDDETSETEFFLECAKLFRRCRWQYIRIARDTGLHPYTSHSWELEVIDRAAEEGGVKGWVDLSKNE